MIDLDALEALVKRGGAYGDERTTLDLIVELRRARACIEEIRHVLEFRSVVTPDVAAAREEFGDILDEYDEGGER